MCGILLGAGQGDEEHFGNSTEPIFMFCGGKAMNVRWAPLLHASLQGCAAEASRAPCIQRCCRGRETFVPESSLRRTGRIPSDRRADDDQRLGQRRPIPLSEPAGVSSATCCPLTSARMAAESSRQSRLCALSISMSKCSRKSSPRTP